VIEVQKLVLGQRGRICFRQRCKLQDGGRTPGRLYGAGTAAMGHRLAGCRVVSWLSRKICSVTTHSDASHYAWPVPLVASARGIVVIGQCGMLRRAQIGGSARRKRRRNGGVVNEHSSRGEPADQCRPSSTSPKRRHWYLGQRHEIEVHGAWLEMRAHGRRRNDNSPSLGLGQSWPSDLSGRITAAFDVTVGGSVGCLLARRFEGDVTDCAINALEHVRHQRLVAVRRRRGCLISMNFANLADRPVVLFGR